MDAKGFRKAASVLSRENGIRLLRYLSSGEWHIASEVSRALDIHTSTVSNLLVPMYELGILQRRLRTSTVRSTFEYRMLSPRVALELDFKSPPDLDKEAVAYCVACVANVFAKVERLGLPGILERLEAHLGTTQPDLDKDLSERLLRKGAGPVRKTFGEILGALHAIIADSIGRAAANRVFDTAAEEARRGHEDVVHRHNLLYRAGGVF